MHTPPFAPRVDISVHTGMFTCLPLCESVWQGVYVWLEICVLVYALACIHVSVYVLGVNICACVGGVYADMSV